MSKTDYYDTLGVSRDADDKALKSAFRKMAMKYHPDRNPGDKKAEAKFKEIGEAYEALKDPQRRAAYDRYGHAAFENGMGGAGAGAGGAGHPFGNASVNDIFEDIFGEMMGGGRSRSQGGRRRGGDVRYNMEISLEDAFHGKEAQIEIPSSVRCGTCSGSGAAPGHQPVKCGTCGGHGQVRASSGFFSVQRTCPNCQGRGSVIKEACRTCRGTGINQKTKNLSVKIPAGIEDGTRIRLAQEGEAGSLGGPPGDLYIFISIEDHPFFERDGADIFCTVPISMTHAALGGHFEVMNIAGAKQRVKVPEGAQSGNRLRLPAKGMPVLRSRKFGDMYIQIAIETPRNLSKKQRKLLQEFEAESSDKNHPKSAEFFTELKRFFGKSG